MMVESSACDVAVLGLGIGGYSAAIRAAQLGLNVISIEKGNLGGTCVNKGCIPTETLLASINLFHKIQQAENLGIVVRDASVNFKKIMARKDNVVNRCIKGVKYLLKKNNVRVVKGNGIIKSRTLIYVQRDDGLEEHITAKNIIIATGSNPPEPPSFQLDKKKLITTDEALGFDNIPESVAIIGGGIHGVEFAEIFNALGVDVKILEKRLHILPSFDKDIGKAFHKILKKRDIEIYTDAKVASIKVEDNRGVGIIAHSSGSQLDLMVEKVLFSAGRKPAIKDLGLENVGVNLRDGFISVDEHMRTNCPGVYAIGDVTGGKMFSHVAFTEGIIAAENIIGMKTTMNYRVVPRCIYTTPEIASVGLSEEEAIKQGYNISVGVCPYIANGRALTLGEREGFVKIVSDKKTNEILGVHILGPNATELVSEAVMAMFFKCTSNELSKIIHPHPSLSEAIMEAASAI